MIVSYRDRSVKVQVRDYGPTVATGRCLDLDDDAFRKLASLGKGVIAVSWRYV